MIKILSEPKPKISITKNKLKEIEKDFRELRHKFSKKEIDKFRKSFYDIKNYRYLYVSEIKKSGKESCWIREKPSAYKFFDNDENKNIAGIRKLFDLFKPKKTDNGFGGKRNNYIEYTSEGDDNENLSPKKIF